MSKQTSIEWFAEKDTELTIQFLEGKLNQIQLAIEKLQCLQQAKQMHKEEIEDAYARGYEYAPLYEIEKQEKDNPVRVTPKQYYQETYGGNNE